MGEVTECREPRRLLKVTWLMCNPACLVSGSWLWSRHHPQPGGPEPQSGCPGQSSVLSSQWGGRRWGEQCLCAPWTPLRQQEDDQTDLRWGSQTSWSGGTAVPGSDSITDFLIPQLMPGKTHKGNVDEHGALESKTVYTFVGGRGLTPRSLLGGSERSGWSGKASWRKQDFEPKLKHLNKGCPL